MKAFASLALLAALGSAAFAQTSYIVSGELTTSDPTFARPTSLTGLSAVGTAAAYDVYAFQVSASGVYVGEMASASPLDGFLLIYANAFNPASPLTNLINGDDDYSGAFSVLPGSSAAVARGSRISNVTGGSNFVNGTGLVLTPGTTYYAVASAFYNSNNTNGQGVGTYSLGIGGGPGNVTPASPVPEPATMAALGFGALALIKRRRKG